jgi:adenylate cyclase class 2
MGSDSITFFINDCATRKVPVNRFQIPTSQTKVEQILHHHRARITMSFEVEMKFRVPTGRSPETLLAQIQAEPSGKKFQSDYYFNHPSRDFALTDEALRLRDEDGRIHITYKGPKLDANTKTREEIEIPLGLTTSDVPQLAQLLTKLGFRQVAVVRKSRNEFQLLWENAQTTLSIDQVDGLGHFVEIEQVVDQNHLDAARQSVQNLARHLGLDASERRSYLELLLQIP